jgi:hypothetical protein
MYLSSEDNSRSTAITLMMEATSTSETSVNYHTTWHNHPEYSNLHTIPAFVLIKTMNTSVRIVGLHAKRSNIMAESLHSCFVFERSWVQISAQRPATLTEVFGIFLGSSKQILRLP